MILCLCSIGIAGAALAIAKCGQFLIVNRPQRSDLIIVLSENFDDFRVERGLSLLRAGFAQQLILNAPNWTRYGRKQADAAEDYLHRNASDQGSRVHECTISSDSTPEEMSQAARCIRLFAPNATSVLIVTSDFLTRRSLATAERVLPGYRWSVVATQESNIGSHWWRNRESAKIVWSEWQKLLWWKIVEQWTLD